MNRLGRWWMPRKPRSRTLRPKRSVRDSWELSTPPKPGRLCGVVVTVLAPCCTLRQKITSHIVYHFTCTSTVEKRSGSFIKKHEFAGPVVPARSSRPGEKPTEERSEHQTSPPSNSPCHSLSSSLSFHWSSYALQAWMVPDPMVTSLRSFQA